jgi:MFS family permease
MSETIADTIPIPVPSQNQQRLLLARLRILMFGHFMAMGAIAPLLNLYLQRHLGFAGWQAGVVTGMLPFGMIVGCLINATVTDRLIRAEHLYAILKICSAFAAILLCFVEQFHSVALVFGIYALSFAPSGAVKEAVCLHHLPSERRNDFGTVRVFATFGWITAGWVVPLLLYVSSRLFPVHPNLFQWSFILAAGVAFINASVALSLPLRDLTETRKRGGKTLFPKGVWRVVSSQSILLLTAATFAVGFLDRYFYFAMGPYLEQLGVEASRVLPLMTIAQVLEIAVLFALGWMLRRWGFRTVMTLGIVLQVARFSLLLFGNGLPTALISLALHGAAFGLFFVPAMMCFDRLCPREYLSSAYLIFMIVIAGISGLSANYTGGWLFDVSSDFTWIWFAPWIIALLGLSITVFAPRFLPNRAESNR